MKVYRISTNPQRQECLLDLMAFDSAGDFGIALQGEELKLTQTGEYSSVKQVREAIAEADFIFMAGELDRTSYFELGMCGALGKKVYIVLSDDAGEVRPADLQLAVQDLDAESISIEGLIEIFE